MIMLDEMANERSTFLIELGFTDLNGDPIVPETMTWTLTDGRGEVINERERVEVETPADTLLIELHGDDLAMSGTKGRELRLLTLEGTYAGESGDVEVTEEVRFLVQDLKWVATPAEEPGP